MEKKTGETIALLFDKNNATAYQALQELQKESTESSRVYPYIDDFIKMMESGHSYLRTRGLTLIACNAKWDRDNKIDKIIEQYLEHITDAKPVTARKCIKLLPLLAKSKPELESRILSALHRADLSICAESMRPLARRDIEKALAEIQAL